MADKKIKQSSDGNVVIKKFNESEAKENKWKKWDTIDKAVSAARQAYTGGYGCCGDSNNKQNDTVTYEKALGDLIDALQKIKDGSLTLKGLGIDGDMPIIAGED